MRSVEKDVQAALESLPPMPPRQLEPLFIILVGLPGTGKTHFSRLLEERLPVITIRTDEVRKALFKAPTYRPAESYWVYRVCHKLIEELLGQGVGVIFDATNLFERNRRQLYDIASRTGARLAVISIVAPEEEVRKRLEARQLSPEPWDLSDATWEVYQSMKGSVEPIRCPHYVVDTSQDLQSSVDRLVKELMQARQDKDS